MDEYSRAARSDGLLKRVFVVSTDDEEVRKSPMSRTLRALAKIGGNIGCSQLKVETGHVQ